MSSNERKIYAVNEMHLINRRGFYTYRWANRNTVIETMTTSDFTFTSNQRSIFWLKSSTQRIRIACIMFGILIITACQCTTTFGIQIHFSIDVALQEVGDFMANSRRCHKFITDKSICIHRNRIKIGQYNKTNEIV